MNLRTCQCVSIFKASLTTKQKEYTVPDFSRTDLIILDDWGLAAMTKPQRLDLLEILEDRNGLKATLITSQLPVEAGHEYIGDPTLADAILDRLVHSAYKINLKGESMRKKNSALTIKNNPAE